MPRKRKQPIAPSEVIDHLRQIIENNNLQPGERLPSERSLALEFRVGRPSVREAIKALQILDVLDSRHGDGTFIKSRAGLSGGWPSQVDLDARNIDLIELLELRKMIEPTAAALSAARRNEKQLAAMEAEWSHRRSAPTTAKTWYARYLFHEAVLQRRRIGAPGRGPISRSMLLRRKLTGQSTPSPRIAIQQHRIILEAIRRRDPEYRGAGHAHSSADRRARSDCSRTRKSVRRQRLKAAEIFPISLHDLRAIFEHAQSALFS
jgi:GntR family transcriptional repressor for pyruvate dehydrogenase complex